MTSFRKPNFLKIGMPGHAENKPHNWTAFINITFSERPGPKVEFVGRTTQLRLQLSQIHFVHLLHLISQPSLVQYLINYLVNSTLLHVYIDSHSNMAGRDRETSTRRARNYVEFAHTATWTSAGFWYRRLQNGGQFGSVYQGYSHFIATTTYCRVLFLAAMRVVALIRWLYCVFLPKEENFKVHWKGTCTVYGRSTWCFDCALCVLFSLAEGKTVVTIWCSVYNKVMWLSHWQTSSQKMEVGVLTTVI